VSPRVQGSLGIAHDEQLTSTLFSLVHTDSASSPAAVGKIASLDIATGYMNLTDWYTRILLHATNHVRFIAAARDANGWYGATGGGRFVPELYAAAA
jgi:hypothetical protein